MRRIFTSPVFTECAGPARWTFPGTAHPHVHRGAGERYFIGQEAQADDCQIAKAGELAALRKEIASLLADLHDAS